MSKILMDRAGNACECCRADNDLHAFEIPVLSPNQQQEELLLCNECIDQFNGEKELNPNHWRCLNDAMWSEHVPVQVFARVALQKLSHENWAQDLIEMFYLDEENQKWAEKWMQSDQDDAVVHVDANGVRLMQGDSVVLVKDLDVKGAGFTAKRGTAVRNIRLVADNPEQIEGKVNGQGIVILTRFVKK
jgi:protein PhnA